MGPGALSDTIYGRNGVEWNAEAWFEWLDETEHEADGAVETLLADCPRQELLRLLLALYTLPVVRPMTCSALRKARRVLQQAQRELNRLHEMRLMFWGPVVARSIWFDLFDVGNQLQQLEVLLRGRRAKNVIETLLLARLTAFVRVYTDGWHDADISALLSVFLGREFAAVQKASAKTGPRAAARAAAKGREVWRQRNRHPLDFYLLRYKTQRGVP
jgi:hypothetical protein